MAYGPPIDEPRPYGLTTSSAMPDQSDPKSLIDNLISSLLSGQLDASPQPAPPQPPEHIKTWKRVLGAIGDALSARGAVQAGAQPQPMGQFASAMARRQSDYNKQLESYNQQSSDRETEKRRMIGQLLGSMIGAQSRQQPRPANMQFKEVTSTINGKKHNILLTLDPANGSIVKREDLGEVPANISVNRPKIIYDENGNAFNYWAPEESGGKGSIEPITDNSGDQIRKTPPANLQGINQQLDNAARLMDEMKSNYQQGSKSMVMRGLGTASANILGGEKGGAMGLSGIASKLDPHAVIHERDRNATATALAFPLTGSRRSVEGARKSLMAIIPHYSDPPEVWDVFDRQMNDLINTARKMPWGDKKAQATSAYEAAFDNFMSNVKSGKKDSGSESDALRRYEEYKKSLGGK